MSEQILVPYDGSPPSEKALEYAFEQFSEADITALYVVPIPEGYWAAFEDPENRIPGAKEADEHGQTILDEATAVAEERGRNLETEIDTGTPDHRIVERAENEAYDTIVIGSHGREGVSRMLLGSVAENVVRRAPVPVIVVR
ncbi:universal stress protein [Natronorubrum sp. JWXQ-INN-674]|uniref:Universal stress protein n=1 Tax=Natronorubrum halalkaliphilum TaxID=2691917 RepID=A0A6B0VLE6_9EURY|nr:universal stress protein [Natronorubrum halalkaliphilum]MXV61935.1 universal stress protein [Natronorubrum halalkaliphilum]